MRAWLGGARRPLPDPQRDLARQAAVDRACLAEVGITSAMLPGWWKPVEIRGRQGKPPRQVYRWVWL